MSHADPSSLGSQTSGWLLNVRDVKGGDLKENRDEMGITHGSGFCSRLVATEHERTTVGCGQESLGAEVTPQQATTA